MLFLGSPKILIQGLLGVYTSTMETNQETVWITWNHKVLALTRQYLPISSPLLVLTSLLSPAFIYVLISQSGLSRFPGFMLPPLGRLTRNLGVFACLSLTLGNSTLYKDLSPWILFIILQLSQRFWSSGELSAIQALSSSSLALSHSFYLLSSSATSLGPFPIPLTFPITPLSSSLDISPAPPWLVISTTFSFL